MYNIMPLVNSARSTFNFWYLLCTISFMKPSFILIPLLLFFSCGPKNGDSANQQLRQENFELKKVNDSLRFIVERSKRTYEGDTIQKLPETPPEKPYPTLAGKHALTLQWISWDKPGSVTIVPGEAGWYSIQGRQNGEQGNYLIIDGKIRPLNNRELEFNGKIEHNVHSLNGSEPCIRTGEQLFKATGTRQYWRLQNMISCDSNTTDYVDIYF